MIGRFEAEGALLAKAREAEAMELNGIAIEGEEKADNLEREDVEQNGRK